ncbi:MAG: hypothetical protein AMXMBFR61_03990 [Fimbriimonadales bacterium]
MRPLFLFLATICPLGAFASTEASIRLQFSQNDLTFLYVSLGFAILSIAFGAFLRFSVLKQSPGNEKMQEVSRAIREGALAYLRKQVATMSIMVILLAVGLYFLYVGNPLYGPVMALWLAVCFVAGVAASYIAGYVGMGMAVMANTRTANAALTTSKGSIETAFRAGGVSGMFTVGMGLLGATLIFLFAREQAMRLLIGFGFGGSLAALFMRVGGGIYTKAADVGADLVGKVEAGIPEDDPRNPATIADNVGDNVGDCAGMAADVFESYEVTLVAAIILGAATAAIFPAGSTAWMKLIIFALIARGLGVLASGIGILGMRGSENVDSNPLTFISRGFWISAVVAAGLTWAFAYYYMQDIKIIGDVTVEWWRFALALTFGIVMAYAIERLTDYYVSTHKRPVTEVAMISRTGPAPMVIQGFSYGMESSVWSLFAIVVALLTPLFIFPPSTFAGTLLSFYGIALTGLGLLTTTGYILAMDTFGPISDNAQGVFEMSGAMKELDEADAGGERSVRAHKIVQRLDAAGNTTKALTKGFAIATAVVAATALFHSFVEDANLAGHVSKEVPQAVKDRQLSPGEADMAQAITQLSPGADGKEVIDRARTALMGTGKSDPTDAEVGRVLQLAIVPLIPADMVMGTRPSVSPEDIYKNLPDAALLATGTKRPPTGLPVDIPQIFLGLLIGGAAPFLFGAYSINAVGRAAFKLIEEVRRQFRADPGIMEGTSKPDYGRCVSIVTAAAQQELLSPGIIAIALPCLVGFGMGFGAQEVTIGGKQFVLTGAQALGGYLAGAILSGQLLAVLLANSGGIWDNAKKKIEDGMYGGKGTDEHKAGVVVDTVGDPFKDTAGPAMNPLIKVMNLVSLLLAPVMIQPMSNTVRAIVVVACIAALGVAVFLSKRGSLASELAQVGPGEERPALEA